MGIDVGGVREIVGVRWRRLYCAGGRCMGAGLDWFAYLYGKEMSCVFAPGNLVLGYPLIPALLRRATRAFFRTEILFYIGSPK